MLESEIKKMIIKKYGSVRYFCNKIDVPYSTIDSILKRGIGKANVLNVIKICDALGLSVDNLRHGIIEPRESENITEQDFLQEMYSLLSKRSDVKYDYSVWLLLSENLLNNVTNLNDNQKQQIISFLKLYEINDKQ